VLTVHRWSADFVMRGEAVAERARAQLDRVQPQGFSRTGAGRNLACISSSVAVTVVSIRDGVILSVHAAKT